MIDREQAIQLVTAWLADHPTDGGNQGPLELSLQEHETMEANFGWIFFYSSKLYRETGELCYSTLSPGTHR